VAAVAAGLLWRLDSYGCWTAVAPGLLWLLGCCGGWAAVAVELLWLLVCWDVSDLKSLCYHLKSFKFRKHVL
jgi:hypothetical protein